MTKKTLAERRAETDQLMHRSLHKTMWPELEHKALLAALAAERNAADGEIERITRQRDEARAEVEMLRAVVQDLCEVLEECVYEIDTRYGPPGSNNIDRELIERARAALAMALGDEATQALACVGKRSNRIDRDLIAHVRAALAKAREGREE